MPAIEAGLLPGFSLLAVEIGAIAVLGYVVVRGLMGQAAGYLAAFQGLIVGLALWGVLMNAAFYVLPGVYGLILAWLVAAVLTATLIWKRRVEPRPTLSAAASFAAIFIAVFWISLSARQLLWVPDIGAHIPLTASMMAGNFPPTFPWNPNEPAFYHYGPDLIIGGLEAGTGLGYVLVTEVLGALSVTTLFLIVGGLIGRNRPLSALIVTVPLMLSAGAWTLVMVGDQPWPVSAVLPVGLPQAGIRASLAEVYFPGAGIPWMSPVVASPPNIFNPSFPMSYALLLVLTERLLARRSRSAVGTATAAVVGAFLILTDEPIFAAFALIWTIVVAVRWMRTRVRRIPDLAYGSAGIALLIGLAVIYGGVMFDSALRNESAQSGLSIVWPDSLDRIQLVSLKRLPGNLGVLSVGPIALVGLVALGWRAGATAPLLATSGLAMLVASWFVRYEFSGSDALRLHGHIRSLLLLASILVVANYLGRLNRRPRVAAGAILAGLVVWPTIASPGADLWFALKSGPQFATPAAERRRIHEGIMGRAELSNDLGPVVSFIRNQLERDASILSPNPSELAIASGRPAPSGYVGFTQYLGLLGPEYVDAIEFLDPEAIRRLGVGYVHSTPEWIDRLPVRSKNWLLNPEYFRVLIQSDQGSLYQILPLFKGLNAGSDARSFIALRRLAGSGAKIYIPPAVHPLERLSMAAALQDARLFGELGDPAHVRSDLGFVPYAGEEVDFVVLPANLAPTGLRPDRRSPVWSRDANSVYAVGDIEHAAGVQEFAPLLVDIEESRTGEGTVRFTVKFEVGDQTGWTGQDWILIGDDRTQWAVPALLGRAEHWYSGQVNPSSRNLRVEYDWDVAAGALQWSTGVGSPRVAQSSASNLAEGSYVLAMRLTLEGRERSILPILRVHASLSGAFSFEFFEGPLAARPGDQSR